LKGKKKPLKWSGGAVLVPMFSNFLLRKVIAKNAEEADTYTVYLPHSSGRKWGSKRGIRGFREQVILPKEAQDPGVCLPLQHKKKGRTPSCL